MRSILVGSLTTIVLASCSVATPSSTASPSTEAASAAATSPSATEQPSSPPQGPAANSIAVTVVDGLTVRDEPSTTAESIGVLGSAGEAVFVVSGPVEDGGHDWYQLASVRVPDGSCAEPTESLSCISWFGWAAGTSATGDAWLAPRPDTCPSSPVDAAAFVSIVTLERLACFGDEEVAMRLYVPPPLPMGCAVRPYHTEPEWMDQCAVSHLLLAEWRGIEDGPPGPGLPVHADPAHISSPSGLPPQWVDIRGQLDHSVSESCAAVANQGETPPELPTPESVILACRANFVVTAVSPSGSQ
jgi:hypothetical protein